MTPEQFFESISTDDGNDFVIKLKEIGLFKTYCSIAEAYHKAEVESSMSKIIQEEAKGILPSQYPTRSILLLRKVKQQLLKQ
jgi:hypothetical protein